MSYPVDPVLVRIWASACRWPEPPDRLFWDEAYAKTTCFGGIFAPPYCNPFGFHIDERRASGPQTSGALSTAPGSRPLNGGGEAEYFKVPIRPGDVITEVSKVVDIYERGGRLGTMVFTIPNRDPLDQPARRVGAHLPRRQYPLPTSSSTIPSSAPGGSRISAPGTASTWWRSSWR